TMRYRAEAPGDLAGAHAPRGAWALLLLSASGTAPPQGAIAARDERQVILIPWPTLVARQLEFLFRRLPALALLRELLHFGGGGLQQLELILDVLLRAEPIAGLPRVPRNQPFPIHCQHLLHKSLGFQRVEVDHAAPGH